MVLGSYTIDGFSRNALDVIFLSSTPSCHGADWDTKVVGLALMPPMTLPAEVSFRAPMLSFVRDSATSRYSLLSAPRITSGSSAPRPHEFEPRSLGMPQ